MLRRNLLWATLFVFPVWAMATSRLAASPAAAAWESLARLAGTWEARDESGAVFTMSYELVSNGTALVEQFDQGPEAMVSVYHLDGESILMTHYCSAGNQPRLRATNFSGIGEIQFDFVDVTNLPTPETGYISGLHMRFVDPNTVVQAWQATSNGQIQPPYVITLTRIDLTLGR